jgi:hypothetical protein
MNGSLMEELSFKGRGGASPARKRRILQEIQRGMFLLLNWRTSLAGRGFSCGTVGGWMAWESGLLSLERSEAGSGNSAISRGKRWETDRRVKWPLGSFITATLGKFSLKWTSTTVAIGHKDLGVFSCETRTISPGRGARDLEGESLLNRSRRESK